MAVQVGAVKIYVAAVLALKTKEKLGETQFPTKIDGFVSPFVINLDKSVFLSAI
jgi:hypothetical protein